jgi:hypothetical protein
VIDVVFDTSRTNGRETLYPAVIHFQDQNRKHSVEFYDEKGQTLATIPFEYHWICVSARGIVGIPGRDQ